MNISFRNKLFIYSTLIVFFTSLSIGTFLYIYMYNSIENNTMDNAKVIVSKADENISNTLLGMKNDVSYLSINPNIIRGDNSILALFNMSQEKDSKKFSKNIDGIEGSIFKVLEGYAETHNNIAYAYMGTKWGGYIEWPDGVEITKYDPRVRPWYIQSVKDTDKAIVSSPYVASDQSKKVIISVTSSVKNNKDELIGVIGLDVSLDKLSDMITNSKIGKMGYLFIFSQDGTILAHPDKNIAYKNINSVLNGYKDNKDIYNIEIDGKPVIVKIFTSKVTGWKFASVVQKSEIRAKANTVGVFILLITFAITFITMIITIFVTDRLTKPIDEIKTLMSEVGNGNFSVRANITSKDEFGELSDCFNIMTDKVNLSYEELTAVYEQLYATEGQLKEKYTELKLNEKALRKSEERFKLAIEGSNDVIWEWDIETDIIFVSDKLFELLNRKPVKTLTLTYLAEEILFYEDRAKVHRELYDHLNNNTVLFKSTYRIKKADDSYLWIYCRGKALRDSKGKAIKVSGSLTDISDRVINEEKMKHMAYFDFLTDLPNRTNFTKLLKKELLNAQDGKSCGAVIFIDLDNFKYINDTLGHDFGDNLLKSISDRLILAKYPKDSICRLGGDEFLFLHPMDNGENLNIFIENLLKLFNSVFQINDKQIFITGSIGIALYPKNGCDASTLLKNADTAMYKAKDFGKNTFAYYDNAMYLELERKTTIESILRNAIEEKELSLYYQPQYNTQDNSLWGFEALLRLNSSKLGFISPAEFIPIAEETGLIVEIGKWVLKEACEKNVEWKKRGLKFSSMCINISSLQIQQSDFTESIRKILNDTGADPGDIELEITETILMKSLDYNIMKLQDLMDMGIRIALDDFGTGYSSLNYLRTIPITTLKIDKSFIDNIASNNKEEAIIDNIIQMAHSLGLYVIAEGVETNNQLEILKNKNCDKIQGYIFSKPLPVSEVEKLI